MLCKILKVQISCFNWAYIYKYYSWSPLFHLYLSYVPYTSFMWADFEHLVTNVTDSPATLLYICEVIAWSKDFGNLVVTQLIKLIKKVPAIYGGDGVAQCGDYSVVLTTEELGFDSQQGREILPFFEVSLPALRPTQPSVWIIPGAISLLVKWPRP